MKINVTKCISDEDRSMMDTDLGMGKFLIVFCCLLCVLVQGDIQNNENQDVQKESNEPVFSQENQKSKPADIVDDSNQEVYHSNDETEENHDESLDTDSTNSFSFGNILKTIMDPVFEEEVPVDKTPVEITEIEEPMEVNVTIEANDTSTLETPEIEQELNKTEKKMKFKCISRNITLENVTSTVKIINNTRLLQILNFDKNDTLSDCVLVMFYAPWCRFCAKVAPSYNALARAFHDLDVVAVDAAHFSNLNARFGTVSVPNILLFHQSRAVVRFNQTDKQFENLVSFVKNHTGMEPDAAVNVTDNDFLGPLPSVPSDETDYLLWISWLFVIIFVTVVFIRSSYGQLYINKIKILWQEHQHIE